MPTYRFSIDRESGKHEQMTFSADNLAHAWECLVDLIEAPDGEDAYMMEEL
jgi:hypothetical protein